MENKLDFEIYTRGAADKLILVDASDYYIRPSNVIVEIEFPNLSTVYSAYINPSLPNVLTTKKLAYDSVVSDFPDGLYKIRFSVSPNKESFICKNYIKLDRVKSIVAEMLQEDCLDVKKIDYLLDIDKFVQAAEATENTSPSKSVEFYKEILKKLNKLSCYGMR